MNVRYVSQHQMEWDNTMKDRVQSKIVHPLKHVLQTENFELSVHLGPARISTRNLEMWLVLQMFDGRNNIVVRSSGADFQEVVAEISFLLRQRLKVMSAPRRLFSLNPFSIAPVERIA